MKIDRASLLVHARAGDSIRAVQDALVRESLTLALEGELPDATVAAWIAEGAPGARARFVDPVDQLVAGFTARFHDGRVVTLEPAPRRSVGPDLVALVFGQRERFATLIAADLRAVVRGAEYASPPFHHEDPPLTTGEAAVLDALDRLIHGDR